MGAMNTRDIALELSLFEFAEMNFSFSSSAGYAAIPIPVESPQTKPNRMDFI